MTICFFYSWGHFFPYQLLLLLVPSWDHWWIVQVLFLKVFFKRFKILINEIGWENFGTMTDPSKMKSLDLILINMKCTGLSADYFLWQGREKYSFVAPEIFKA